MFLVSVALDGITGTDVLMNVVRAPSGSNGGAIKLREAWVTNGATTTGTVSFSLQLLTYTGGTSLSGTVAAAVGGTTSHWTADTPKQWTITDGVIEANEYLVIKKVEATSASNPTRSFATFVFDEGK